MHVKCALQPLRLLDSGQQQGHGTTQRLQQTLQVCYGGHSAASMRLGQQGALRQVNMYRPHLYVHMIISDVRPHVLLKVSPMLQDEAVYGHAAKTNALLPVGCI
jgi:hypothetical protein